LGELTHGEGTMRQFAAFGILAALFLLLVGSRFQASDGDKLAKVSRLVAGKVQAALPQADKLAGPVNAVRALLPQRLEDRVRARLVADQKLAGVAFVVSSEGGTVKLGGVVADAAARKWAVEIAASTVGVEKVVDELAVPE
jgi:hyperosmotically inducible protein